MQDESNQETLHSPEQDTVPAPLQAAAAQGISFTALSPPAQGDVVSGLALAIAGIGPATAEGLPEGSWPRDVGTNDAWAATVLSPSGWYVILTQDCDLVRSPVDEPTVLVAPLTVIPRSDWDDLRRSYSARSFAYPRDKFTSLNDDEGVAVELPWTSSVLKGSLQAPGVQAMRPLTGPERREFSLWLSQRTGRTPMPDDVVMRVLDPAYEVRRSLLKKHAKGSKNLDAQAVAAVERWFVRRRENQVTFFGQLTMKSLTHAKLLDEKYQPDFDKIKSCRAALENTFVQKMGKPGSLKESHYEIRVILGMLEKMKASDFVEFSLLVR
ncbi:hypothetical protein OG458_42850 (plasmid) [Streptomyces sp. NBC_01281]|uniref:hypothetical protein n=1 Tax=Streptomyces sp. NBC_01281 TaxID=2903811 RepID=UPI002E0FA739|nr:hypothetical protein OG458_42850 [Streptomyces sp. NBC_01281]